MLGERDARIAEACLSQVEDGLARQQLVGVRVALRQARLHLTNLILRDEGTAWRDLLAIADDEELVATEQGG